MLVEDVIQSFTYQNQEPLGPIGAPRSDGEQALYEQWVAVVRGQLDPARFDALWAIGQALSQEAAVNYALAMTIVMHP